MLVKMPNSNGKYKAAENLNFQNLGCLPRNSEIEDKLKEYHRLFDGESHHISLFKLRKIALSVMEFFGNFKRFYDKYDHDQASFKHIFFTKYFGFISMGILPTIFCLVFLPELTLADLGLTFIYKTAQFSIFWILGLSI